jgi:hypothetical protein
MDKTLTGDYAVVEKYVSKNSAGLVVEVREIGLLEIEAFEPQIEAPGLLPVDLAIVDLKSPAAKEI